MKVIGRLHDFCLPNTGRFIMFSVITNIYNKKTKGPTLIELFTATGKPKNFFFTTRDVRCLHHGWHRYDIQVLATHASTCWRVCVSRREGENKKENMREGDRLEDLGVDGRIMFRCGVVNLNSLSLGQGKVAGFCEHGNWPLDSIECGQLRD